MFAHLPQLNGLRVFESAARLGSFKRAAEELHVTPTAVSHQIRALESRLGVALFVREPRSVTLTEDGTRLARSANTALHEVSAAIDELMAPSHVLTVATTPSFAALWLVPKLAEFEKVNPGIQVQLRTDEAVENLLQSHIDVAIRYGEPDGDEEGSEVLSHEWFGAYYKRANLRKRSGRGSLVSRVMLIETHWKNSALPSIGWRQWLARYAPSIHGPRINAFDSELHALQAAMTGEGIVLTSDILASTAVEHGWLEPYQPQRKLPGLCYRLILAPGRRRSRQVVAFRDWLARVLDRSRA